MARCTAAVRQVWPECLAEAQKYVDRNMSHVVSLMPRETTTDKQDDTTCVQSSSQGSSHRINSVQSHPLSNCDRAQSNGDRAQSNGDRVQSQGLSSQKDGLTTHRSDDSSSGGSRDSSSGCSRDGCSDGNSNVDHQGHGELPVSYGKSMVDEHDTTARYTMNHPLNTCYKSPSTYTLYQYIRLIHFLNPKTAKAKVR